MLPVNDAIYQGKLDNFCAVYAVLNAIKLISDMNNMQARVMLNEVLYHESLDRANWLRVLGHETDYEALVSRMLKQWEGHFKYTSFCPFEPHNFEKNIFQHAYEDNEEDNSSDSPEKKIMKKFLKPQTIKLLENIRKIFKGEEFKLEQAFKNPEVSLDTVWSTLKKYVVEGKSTAVIRFCRFMPEKIGPMIDHWTTVREVTDDALHFFDCSLEKTGWYVMPRERLYVAPFASIPPQTLALKEGYTLTLENREFAVICPENIHILQVGKSPFSKN